MRLITLSFVIIISACQHTAPIESVDSASDDSADDSTGTDSEVDTSSDTNSDTPEGVVIQGRLMWQKTGDGCGGQWAEVVACCDNLVLGGFDDWRLPDITELRGLVTGCELTETCDVVAPDCLDVSCGSSADCYPGCKLFVGPDDEGCYWPSDLDGVCDTFWSSTACADDDTGVWCVGFDAGDISAQYKTNHLRSRCVRGG